MRKAGIIGGTGPESTIDYYSSIIRSYQDRLGTKEELPELLIISINMYRIFSFMEKEDLDGLADYLSAAVDSLQRAGADFALIAANTPHIIFPELRERAGIPMISIIEEAVRRAKERELKKLVLLGTKFTMEEDFYKVPFREAGMDIIVPAPEEQQYIHTKTVKELENGIVNPDTKARFLAIAERLITEEGADALILGCTGFPMIFKPEDTVVPQLNTVEIHVERIVEEILGY